MSRRTGDDAGRRAGARGDRRPSREVASHATLAATDEHEAITYRVVRSGRRIRTIQIGIERGEVTVRAPMRSDDREIAAAVQARAGWIARQRASAPPPAGLEDGAPVPYRGGTLALSVVESTQTTATQVERDLLGLHVTLPAGTEPAERTASIEAAVAGWLRARAVEVLPARVQHHAESLGWQPSRVLVRDQRRRWGSCAPDGALRLNWRVIMLDDEVTDYVVLHELAHLREANHGPRFHALMDRILPGHRALRTRLREAGRMLPL